MMTFDDYIRFTEEWLRALVDIEKFRRDCKVGYMSNGEVLDTFYAFTAARGKGDKGYFWLVYEQGQGEIKSDLRAQLRALAELIEHEIERLRRHSGRGRAWPVEFFDRPEWDQMSQAAADLLKHVERDGWFFEPRPTREERQRRG